MDNSAERDNKVYQLQVELLTLLKRPRGLLFRWISQNKTKVLQIRKEIQATDRKASLYLNWGGPYTKDMLLEQRFDPHRMCSEKPFQGG